MSGNKIFILIFFVLITHISIGQTPNINLVNTNVNVCNGATSAVFDYSATTGNEYIIKAAGRASFLNMSGYLQLSGSSVTVSFSSATTAGVYSANLYVRNATDTSVAYPISVTVLPTFTAGSIATVGQTICPNAQAFTIGSTANASGGDGNIIYEWRIDGTAILNSNAPTFTPTYAGTYTRWAKDGQCNTVWVKSTGNYKITIHPFFNPGVIDSAGETVCNNVRPSQISSTTTASGGNNTITYQWKVNGSVITGAANATYRPPTQTVAGVYNYTREAKDGVCTNGEYRVSEGIRTITVLPAFTAGSIATAGQTICHNTPAMTIGSTAHASGGNGDIIYEWRRNGTAIINSNSHTFTPTEAGIYTRWAKDGQCNVSWTKSLGEWELKIRPEFKAGSIASTGENVYANMQTSPIGSTISATGGDNIVTYRWKVNGSLISGESSATYTPLSEVTGTYIYTREAKDGTCSDWKASDGSWKLTIYPEFTPGVITQGEEIVCYNSETTTIGSILNASGGGSNIIYRWKKDGTIVSGASGATYTPSSQVAGTFIYTREAKDEGNSGWNASANSWQLTVYPELDPGIIALGEETVCYNTGTTVIGSLLDASGGDDNIIYRWKKNGTIILGASGATCIPSSEVAGTYIYTREAKDGECSDWKVSAGSWQLIVYPEFTAGTIMSGEETVCYNTETTVIGSVLNASGGDGNFTYRWKKDGVIIPGTSSATYSPSSLIAGTYIYTREAKDGECSDWKASTGSWQLTVYPEFTAGTIMSEERTVCHNAAPIVIGSVLDASGGNDDIIYRWKKNGTIIPGVSGTTYSPSSLIAGTYIYTREAKDGECSDWKISTGLWQIIVFPEFTSGTIVSGEETLCHNSAFMIENTTLASGGSGNISYRWKKDGDIIQESNTSTYGHLTSGEGTFSFTREAKDLVCSEWVASSGTYKVNIHNEFNPGIINPGKYTTCVNNDAEIILNFQEASGGDNNLMYRWKKNSEIIENANNKDYQPIITEPGMFLYTREAKDGLCSDWVTSENTLLLLVNPLPEIPNIPFGEDVICHFTDKTEFETGLLANATKYNWDLSPSTSGIITGNGNRVSVTWNRDFTGIVNLKVQSENECGISDDYSESLMIDINESPIVNFTKVTNPVCANQNELNYTVDKLKDVSYLWEIERGIILSQEDNEVIVKWDQDISKNPGILKILVKNNDTGCEYESAINIVSFGYAPDLNDIIAKTDKSGTPYILIYPNPSSEFFYQWYKNGTEINGATKQYFYPPEFGQALEKDSEYRVYISEVNNSSCGNYSNSYKYTGTLEDSNLYSVYPNPNNGNFKICFNDLLKEYEENVFVEIYSSIGVKIFESNISTDREHEFNINLSEGIYIMYLNSEKEGIISKKVIVE